MSRSISSSTWINFWNWDWTWDDSSMWLWVHSWLKSTFKRFCKSTWPLRHYFLMGKLKILISFLIHYSLEPSFPKPHSTHLPPLKPILLTFSFNFLESLHEMGPCKKLATQAKHPRIEKSSEHRANVKSNSEGHHAIGSPSLSSVVEPWSSMWIWENLQYSLRAANHQPTIWICDGCPPPRA